MKIRTGRVWSAVSVIFGLMVVFVLLSGAAPAGSDPDSAVSGWFRGLRAPGTGISCCDVSDCRGVRTRIVGGRLEAFIGRSEFGLAAPDDWVAVPDDARLPPGPNPVGEPVACYYGGRVICFADGAGT